MAQQELIEKKATECLENFLKDLITEIGKITKEDVAIMKITTHEMILLNQAEINIYNNFVDLLESIEDEGIQDPDLGMALKELTESLKEFKLYIA